MKSTAKFKEATIRVLSKRAGERCSLCHITTSKPNQSYESQFINLGEAAHIKGARKAKNNRFDESMSNLERASIKNAIWLCQPCHKKIDSDSITYTTKFLLKAKSIHEKRVSNGFFDKSWKQIEELDNEIKGLKDNINSKKKLELLQDEKILEFKLKIEKLENERAQLKQKLSELEYQVLQLDTGEIDSNSTEIIDAFKDKNYLKLKELLSENKLKIEESNLSIKRIIKGTIHEIDEEYEIAEENYLKAYLINSSLKNIEIYISFLERRTKIQEAIKFLEIEISNFEGSKAVSNLESYLSQLLNGIRKYEEALIVLGNAIDKVKTFDDLDNQIYLAKLHSSKGSLLTSLGKFKEALKSFEVALNILWQAPAENEDIDYFKTLGNLWNRTGLLYLKNNDLEDSLHHFKSAISIFSDQLYYDDLHLSVIFLNVSDIYLTPPKMLNLPECLNYLSKAKSIIDKNYNKHPLQYLKYYLGYKLKFCNYYIVKNEHYEAERGFNEIIEIIDFYTKSLNMNLSDEKVLIYTNYSILLQNINKSEESLKYCDLAIELIESTSLENDYSSHLALIKLYFQKLQLTNDITLKPKIKFHSSKIDYNPKTLIWKKMAEEL